MLEILTSYGLSCLLPHPLNSYVEIPTSNIYFIGNRDIKNIIKAGWGHQDGALLQWDWYSYMKSKRYQTVICKIRREISGRSKLATTWFWTLGLLNCEGRHFCYLNHLVCCVLLWWPYQTNIVPQDILFSTQHKLSS